MCVAIRREEANLTLTSEAADHVTRAGRWLNGVGVRAPHRSAAAAAGRETTLIWPAGMDRPVASRSGFARADLRREWHGHRVARTERGIPRKLEGGRLVGATASRRAGLRRRCSFAVREEGQMKYAGAGGIRIAYDDEGAWADDAVVFLPGGATAAGVSSPCWRSAWLPGIGSSGWTGADFNGQSTVVLDGERATGES